MAEPKSMTAPPRQPIGWPTHRFQHCLKTVMPSAGIGANMTLHKNIHSELLPTAHLYNKAPERWRGHVLPPLELQNRRTDHQAGGRQREAQQLSRAGSKLEQSRPHTRDKPQSRASQSRSTHLEMRPPSAAYSTTIVFRREPPAAWSRDSKLDIPRLKALMREHTFQPGNFSTLYKCSKQKLDEIANRLSYDPYERREQLIVSDNPDEADACLYTKADIDAIVQRLATMKAAPEQEPEPEKKPLSKELSAKEKEIVERLSKYEHPADKVKSAEDEEKAAEKKTVTQAELEAMLARLTQRQERTGGTVVEEERRKVSAEEMDNILTRLTTYDSMKWPPESKPEIYRLHAK